MSSKKLLVNDNMSQLLQRNYFEIRLLEILWNFIFEENTVLVCGKFLPTLITATFCSTFFSSSSTHYHHSCIYYEIRSFTHIVTSILQFCRGCFFPEGNQLYWTAGYFTSHISYVVSSVKSSFFFFKFLKHCWSFSHCHFKVMCPSKYFGFSKE